MGANRTFRLRDRLRRAFRRREIFLRGEDRIRYIAISPAVQVAAALLALTMVLLTAFGLLGTALYRDAASSREDVLAEMRAEYWTLLQTLDALSESVADAEANRAGTSGALVRDMVRKEMDRFRGLFPEGAGSGGDLLADRLTRHSVPDGLLLAAIYCVYIVILGVVRPELVPAVPKEERDAMPRGELWAQFFKVVLPPLALVLSVLGSIIAGVAAPTEAASMGALGAILVTAFARRMSYKVLVDTMQATTKITAMVMFILICAQAFSLGFRGLRGEDLITDLFEFLPGGVAADIWFLMLLIFVLGFFIEWIEISYIAVPLFLPVFVSQNVDLTWLAMLICVNLQTSFLTPPFGWALFFLRGVAPPQVTTRHMYLGIIPFVAMQVVTVALVFFFPQLALWLPKAIGW